jgi:hypothetical protein
MSRWGIGGVWIGGAFCAALLLAQPALAQGSAIDRVVELVGEARRSPCFQPPSRAPLAQPVPMELAVAAAQGDGPAMQRIGEGYLSDPARARQALEWLERAALAGALSAAADVGSFYASGRGTMQDEALAVGWWRYGASRGELRAMACLSAAHLLGRGVPQDLAEAARWAMLREMRAPGRLLLRPAAADFDRTLPPQTLAAARRLAREPLEPAPPPGAAPLPSPGGLPMAGARTAQGR